MKKKNLFKALVCTFALAAMPVIAHTASAEEITPPDATVVTAAVDPVPVTTQPFTLTSAASTTVSFSTVAVSSKAGESLAAETTTTLAATAAAPSAEGETASETTTTAATTSDPNRVPVQEVQLNATEAQIAAGTTFKITPKQIPGNTTDKVVYKFISSDESIATVDDKGVVTAIKPGKVTISVIADSLIPIVADKTVETYTVLILDASGSMSGEPAAAQKEAAIKFCTDTLSSPNGANHKFAVVTMATSAAVATNFTNDLQKLTDTINATRASGTTNYTDALNKAAGLLKDVSANAVKNIIFCSDGLPCEGGTSTTGKYTSSDSSYYKYANAAVALAEELSKDYNIYTLGFFHKLDPSEQAFSNILMKDIASSPTQSYIVTDPENLSSAFAEVSNSVIHYNRVGTIKKAVDVEVTPAKAAAPKKSDDKKDDQDSPKTGDNNNNAVLVSIMFVGIAAAVATRKSRRTDK